MRDLPKQSLTSVSFAALQLAKTSMLALLTLLLITACGGSTREGEEPARLVSFESSLVVQESWRYDVGDGPDGNGFKLRPVVLGEFVFVASADGNLVCLNLADGSERWVVESDHSFSGGPGVGDGLVVVGTDQGQLHTYKATTGELLWSAAVPSEVLAAPVIEKGVVVVSTADGNILAYAKRDGERLWSQQQVQPALTLRGSSTPVGLGGAIFAGFDNGKVAGFDPATGRQFFVRPVAEPTGKTQIERIIDVNADLVSDGRSLYASTYQGKTVKINLQSGENEWSVDQSVEAGIALGRNDLFVTDANGHVTALSAISGREQWKNQQLHRRGVTGPAVIQERSVGDIVIVADKSGYVHFLTGDKGQLVARESVTGGVWVQPVATERNVLVFSDSGRVTAFTVPKATVAE